MRMIFFRSFRPLFLPRTDPQFLRCLGLLDQLLERLLQYYQPVSVPLGHGENSSFFHLPSLILSRGHSCLAQRVHSRVAATHRLATVSTPSRNVPFSAK